MSLHATLPLSGKRKQLAIASCHMNDGHSSNALSQAPRTGNPADRNMTNSTVLIRFDRHYVATGCVTGLCDCCVKTELGRKEQERPEDGKG